MKALRDKTIMTFDPYADPFNHLKHHEEHLKQAHHVIDNTTPRRYSSQGLIYDRYKIKESQRSIKKQNETLVNNIYSIMDPLFTSKSSEYRPFNALNNSQCTLSYTHTGSLNYNVRKNKKDCKYNT